MGWKRSRLAAILLAVLATFLWSTSWVLIKIGLKADLPPITFAGLRYVLAWLCLSPVLMLNPRYRGQAARLNRKEWARLALLGVIAYTLAQATQYLGLAYLPAAMMSLVLNLTSLFVALSGIYVLKEMPSSMQWAGISMTVLGMGIYFLPVTLSGVQWLGILFGLLCLGANVPAALLGRHINREKRLSPLVVTWASMGVGSILMLVTGLALQGLGHISGQDWLIIAWLAVVNTALAFTIWNNTLRVLTAMESSIINNLMMPQVAIMAWIFLKESLSVKEIIGLILVGVGVVIVQIRRPRAALGPELSPERPI